MKITKQKPLKGIGVRADEKKLERAHSLGLDLGILFRKALDQEIARREGTCPTCGTKTKKL
jgi:hypothetical protein